MPPTNQVGGNQQMGMMMITTATASQATNQYGKAPPMANPKQLNRTTAGKDLNTGYNKNTAINTVRRRYLVKLHQTHRTLPNRPSNAPDNKIGGNQQDGYDDVLPPSCIASRNQYGRSAANG